MLDIAKLDIVQYPHPSLRRIAKPIQNITPLVKDVADRMFELMYEYHGVGLAGPQVGLPWQIFVLDTPDGDGKNKQVFINPKVTLKQIPRMKLEVEGCLSLLGVTANIPRPIKDVRIEWLDLEGKNHTQTYSGFKGRAVLHEFDHLHGKLFVDYLEPDEQLKMALGYLETQFDWCQNRTKKIPQNDELNKQLDELETLIL